MRISDWSSDVCSSDLLAADRGHADAIAIAADAVDDAGDQMLHLRMVRAAETQRVEVGDRARAHGEDVAQYAADPGRRALIGDRKSVVQGKKVAGRSRSSPDP